MVSTKFETVEFFWMWLFPLPLEVPDTRAPEPHCSAEGNYFHSLTFFMKFPKQLSTSFLHITRGFFFSRGDFRDAQQEYFLGTSVSHKGKIIDDFTDV